MRLFVITLALLIGSLSAFAADVAGAYALTIDTPMGAVDVTLTLKLDGDKVSGTIETPMGALPVTGTVKDSDLSLTADIQGQPATIALKVTDDGKISGSLNIAGMDIPLAGAKKAA